MINFTLLGAGRIGKMHAKIISDHPDANLVNVYDVNEEFASQVANDHNANIAQSPIDAIKDENIMSNINKYNEAFCESFEIDSETLEALEYQSIQAWDSVGHMALMATLEESFEIEMEIDDIIGFSSYKVGKEVMKKYGVDIDE